MKIENAIKIEGALSRNRALTSLSPGDSVRVVILEKIDNARAVVNLLGNKVTAQFSEGVPNEKTVLLTITGNSGGKLVFKRQTGSSEAMTFKSVLLGDKIPDQLFLRSIGAGVSDIFTFNRLLLQHRLKRRITDHKKIFSRLLSQGFSEKELSSLSMFGLKKMPSIITHFSDLFVENSVSDSELEELETKLGNLSNEDLQMLFDSVFDESSALFLLNIDSTYRWFNILFEEDYICISFEFEKSGLIQLVAKEDTTDINISLFFESGDFRKMFMSEFENLDKIIRNSNKKIRLVTWLLSDSVTMLNKEINRAVQNPVLDIRA